MFGAIIGDMVSSSFISRNDVQVEDCLLLNKESTYTEYTIMTIAVAEALVNSKGQDDKRKKEALTMSIKTWGQKYPNAKHENMIPQWRLNKNLKTYDSYVNGVAASVSSVGKLFNTLEETRRIARLIAEVMHTPIEKIKDIEAVASAIFMARMGFSKKEIWNYIIHEFEYDLSRPYEEIQSLNNNIYKEAVPIAIMIFMKGKDYEDVIRMAASLERNHTYLACIAGGIAEAFYGIPRNLKKECKKQLSKDVLSALEHYLNSPFVQFDKEARKHNRAWAIFLNFPNTLDILYEQLKDRRYVKLKDFPNQLLNYDWYIPEEARVGDSFFYILPYGNVERISRLIEELEDYPDEWSIKDYHNMLAIMKEEKVQYEQYEGTLFYEADLQYVYQHHEKNKMLTSFGAIAGVGTIHKRYNPALIRNDENDTVLSRKQIVELLETVSLHFPETDYLFSLGESLPEREEKDYGNLVQAFVANNSFDKSLAEILEDEKYRGYLTVEELFVSDKTEWTAPRWCKSGDIVFFMFTKTARSTISRLTTEYNRNRFNYSSREQRIIEKALQRGRELYKKMGGCIFAFARVNGDIIFEKPDRNSVNHFHGSIYAPMDRITILQEPISIEDFREFLTILRGPTITPVVGDAFEKLKQLIIDKNDVPEFFKSLKSTPTPLREINDKNWLSIGKEYRRRFFLEEAFRGYYVDFLLEKLGDQKSFYRECGCYKTAGNPPRVDNIIKFFGRYLPVEIKLNINNELDLPRQVRQYCHLSYVDLGKGRILADPKKELYTDNVLIIDTEKVYLFDYKQNSIQEIYELDYLVDETMIPGLRELIKSKLRYDM